MMQTFFQFYLQWNVRRYRVQTPIKYNISCFSRGRPYWSHDFGHVQLHRTLHIAPMKPTTVEGRHRYPKYFVSFGARHASRQRARVQNNSRSPKNMEKITTSTEKPPDTVDNKRSFQTNMDGFAALTLVPGSGAVARALRDFPLYLSSDQVIDHLSIDRSIDKIELSPSFVVLEKQDCYTLRANSSI